MSSSPYDYRPENGDGFDGRPPKKRKAALWIGLIVGFAAVIALVVTGFFAPGFFVGDDQPSSQRPTTSVRETPSASASVAAPMEQIIRDMVDKINAADEPGALGLLCADSASGIKSNVRDLISRKPNLHIDKILQDVNPRKVNAEAKGSFEGRQVFVTLVATDVSAGPCVSTVYDFLLD